MTTADSTRDSTEGTLRREFSLWSTFSLAFAFISPIVALYGIFGIGVSTIGPGFWWGFLITLAGQMLVALTFGMLASRWPFEGSVYQWSRRLVGPRYGWFAGWTYIWTLVIAMTAVAYSGAAFLSALLGLSGGRSTLVLLALLMLGTVTLGNTIARSVVKWTVGLCMFAELIGSVGVGAYLLLFHRVNPFSIVTDGFSWSGTSFMSAPFVLAIAYAGWSFLGFESAGAIAEEVEDPRRAVPRAMALSLLCVAGVVCFSSLAILLALPDLGAVTSGAVADPVLDTLDAYLPTPAVKIMLGLFVIAFLASLLGIQTAVSRVVWAFARDEALPGHRALSVLTGADRMPSRAVLLTGVVAALLFAPLQNSHINSILVAFTSAGFYLAFSFPVVGLAVARIRGTWVSGPFAVGRYGGAIAWLALAWLVLETVNIVWPRTPEAGWAVNWAPFLMAGILGALGAVVLRVWVSPQALAPVTDDADTTD
jgi:amino acid transporter